MAEESPGRPESVSAQDIYELLRQTDEPYTTTDLSEYFDVSRRTIRKRLDDVVEFDGIQTKDVAQSTIFWYSTRASVEQKQSWTSEIDYERKPVGRAEIARETHEERASIRGVWLTRRERILSNRAVAGQRDPDQQSIYLRTDLWTALGQYIDEMEMTWPNVLEDAYDDESDPLIDLEEWYIDEATFRYYTEEIPLFSTNSFTVEGFGELLFEKQDVNARLANLDSDGGDIPVDEADEIVPEFEDLLQAGDAFDAFVCEMHGYGWSR